jgi:hypothetical protein
MSILEGRLTQAEAAGVLGVKQPRISYIKRRPRPTSQSVAAPAQQVCSSLSPAASGLFSRRLVSGEPNRTYPSPRPSVEALADPIAPR